MNLFSEVVGQNTEMSDINRQQCVSFLYNRPSFENGLTAYWFNIYGVLDGLFNWAIARDIMNCNPLPTDKPNRPQGFIPYIQKRRVEKTN